MRTKLAVFLIMSVVTWMSAAQVAAGSADFSGAEPRSIESSLPQQRIFSTSMPQHSSGSAESLQQTAARECDKEIPFTASVTALVNRLVRSSNVVRGVQCPIPPIPDLSTEHEPHP